MPRKTSDDVLTSKQLRALACVLSSPRPLTARELASRLGVSHVQGFNYLRVLRHKGVVGGEPGKVRTAAARVRFVPATALQGEGRQ